MKLFTVRDDKFKGTRTFDAKIKLSIVAKFNYFMDAKLSIFTIVNELETSALYMAFCFSFQSSNWAFLNFHPLTLLVDGERLQWDHSEVDHNGDVGSGYVLENMYINLDSSKIKKLAFAKIVEGQLGVIEFAINYDDRTCLRQLSDYIDNMQGREIAVTESDAITTIPLSMNLIADELKKLAELRDIGVLTEDEFQKQKIKLLDQI
jgi:hypothetical protein